MSKKMKLSLDDLKVQSYVTSLESEKNKLGGGYSDDTGVWQCTGCGQGTEPACTFEPPTIFC